MSMMTMFMEENRRRDEENRRRDEEREERFLQLLQSIQPQTKAVTAVEGKSDLLPELMREITQFSYDPESGTPFSTWMGRFEAVLGNQGMQLSDHDKTGALLSKLDLETYNSYTDHIMPRTPGSLSYEETKEVLEDMLGDKISVFRRRIDVMRLAIGNLTFRKLRSTINRMVALAQFDSLTKENFKCLIYISALQGTKYADIRTRLLSKLEKQEGCTLADLVNESESIIALKKDSDLVDDTTHHVVNAVQRGNQRKKNRQDLPSKEYPRASTKGACFLCGSLLHLKKDCPQNDCHNKRGPTRQLRIKKIEGDLKANRRYTEVSFGETKVRMQLDSGADVTVINREAWEQIGSPTLEKTTTSLGAANGTPIEVLGQFDVQFTCGGHSGHGRCYVAENIEQLLGIEWMNQLPPLQKAFNAICCKIEQKPEEEGRHLAKVLAGEFPDVFREELGKCKTKAQLLVKQGTRPIFCRQRKIPFAREEAVNAELERLVQQGVLKKVDYSNWAAPIVVVAKKNGSVRICADFKTGLNEALEMHRHPLPTPDEIFARLNQGAWFTQIDFADAYLQMEVEDDSKELVTINTHKGLFQYQRLPFGVKCAPGIFQEAMDRMITGLEGCAAYLDDVIVTGSTLEEHNNNVQALFKRIADCGFRVRMEKCSFAKPEIKFLGHVVSRDGRRPDPEKIEAIAEMPVPKDPKQLKSFLGMISYYSSFVPEMRSMRGPLDDLEREDKFVWTAEHQKVLEKLKKVLQSDLLLTHFDPGLDIVVAADACDYGVGAVISHRFPNGTEKAIAHASRSLTKAEKNYGQIEKEALALVIGVRKFHRYIYGRRFLLLTDHKPLLSIFGSKVGISAHSANRLQRWELVLLAYDFVIEYRRSTHFGQADALSRLIASKKLPEDEDIVIAKIEQDVRAVQGDVIRHLPVTKEDIRRMTEEDSEFQLVVEAVSTGRWPKFQAGSTLHAFHSRSADLSVYEGALFMGTRAVIPPALRSRVLKMLHEGHPGVTRMKMLARRYVYWQGIDRDIEDRVKFCSSCQLAAKMPVRNELSPWPTPDCAWERIHIDFAGPMEGMMFLIVVDAFSKWPEVVQMRTSTTTATIKELGRIFAQQGYPKVLVSDNGTQFTAKEFQDYCQKNGIQHIRSPPYQPHCNGQAERFVDTFKRTLQKLQGEGVMADALQTFLLTYRTTPCASLSGLKTPAEKFLGRILRTPLSDLQLKRTVTHLHRNDQEMKEVKSGRKRREFAEEDAVFAREYSDPNHPKWVPGRIKRRLGRHVYEVEVRGKMQHRHANQLRKRETDDALKIMCDTFDLPFLPPSETPQAASEEANSPEPPDMPETEEVHVIPEPQEPRPARTRRPPRRLEMDSQRKKYLIV